MDSGQWYSSRTQDGDLRLRLRTGEGRPLSTLPKSDILCPASRFYTTIPSP